MNPGTTYMLAVFPETEKLKGVIFAGAYRDYWKVPD